MRKRSLTFPKTNRLTLPVEFTRVKHQGKAQRGSLFLLGVLAHEDQDQFRVGFVTSKRIGGAVVRNRVRGMKPRLVELNGSEPDHSPGPEAGALMKADIDALAVRVAALPVRYRDAVVLRHVQELSYEEAADALGQPVGTVKSNVHRGLKLLRGDEDDHADD